MRLVLSDWITGLYLINSMKLWSWRYDLRVVILFLYHKTDALISINPRSSEVMMMFHLLSLLRVLSLAAADDTVREGGKYKINDSIIAIIVDSIFLLLWLHSDSCTVEETAYENES